MQIHSQALRDFASAQKSEGENMTRLMRKTAQDSKMLKALTVMASLYLPASLLAVHPISSVNFVSLATELRLFHAPSCIVVVLSFPPLNTPFS